MLFYQVTKPFRVGLGISASFGFTIRHPSIVRHKLCLIELDVFGRRLLKIIKCFGFHDKTIANFRLTYFVCNSCQNAPRHNSPNVLELFLSFGESPPIGHASLTTAHVRK